MGFRAVLGRGRWFVVVTGVLALVLGIVPASAGGRSDGHLRENPTAPAVAGELIVRLRPDFGACAHCLVAERRGLRALTGTYVLDQLRLRHHITAMEPLFGGVHARKQRVAARRRFGRRGSPSLGNPAAPLEQIYLVRVDPKSDLTRLAAEFRRDPNVVSAEPNYLYSARDEGGGEVLAHREPASEHISDFPLPPDDPFFDSDGSWGQDFPDLWGLFQIEAPAAWQRSLGEGVVVAVADSGLDVEHPDIAPNLWQNETEIPANGLDDDGNGYVDDVHGWDFTRCVFFSVSEGCIQDKEQGADVSDGLGHGTHVAGIIAAAGNNGEGVIGVAPRAEVMVVKVLNAEGRGSLRDAAEGLLYAAEQGARLINASWSGPPSDTITEVVQYIRAEFNVVVVGAAGNDHVPLERGMYPAGLPEALGVGAVTHTDEQAEFSNFGGPLDLVGPGGGEKEPEGVLRPDRSILSLLARGSEFGTICYSEFPCDEDLDECEPIEVCDVAPWVVGGRYVRRGGTSMAAPYVSGVAALVLGAYPEFSAGQVRQALLEGADDLGPAGWDKDYGYGRVNARRAVELGVLPVAEIRVPENRAKVWERNFPLEVRGTAAGGQGVLTRWRLEIAPAQGGAAVQVARGSTPALDTVLGSVAFDSPLALERGKRYRLTLHVEDASGAVASDSKTFLVPNPKFALIPIPDPRFEGAQAYTISANAERIAFERFTRAEQAAVVILDPASETILQFPEAYDPHLSPDGRYLFYTHFGGAALYDIERVERDDLPLPTSRIQSFSYTVSEGAREIAFLSPFDLDPRVGNSDRSFEIFVFEAQTGVVRQITDGPARVFQPEIDDLVMSRNGRRLAFTSRSDLDPSASAAQKPQIFLYDADTDRIRQLTGIIHRVRSAHRPAVDADGTRVAYEGPGDVRVLPLTSEMSRKIADGTTIFGRLFLSDDGRWLGFEATDDLDPTVVNEDLSPEIFIADLATDEITQVTDRNSLLEITDFAMATRALVFVGSLLGPVHTTRTGITLTPYNVRTVRMQRPNTPPVISVPGELRAQEGEPFSVQLTAQDSDRDALILYAEISDPPELRLRGFPESVLLDYGDGTGELRFVPRYDQAGTYTLTLGAFDERGAVEAERVPLIVADTQPEGDADCDGSLGPADISALIGAIFDSSARARCVTADTNDDGTVQVDDLLGLLAKLAR